MSTNSLNIECVNSPAEAPNYARDHIDFRTAEISKVIVVGRGTVAGKATVDFQFRDAQGGEYVAMLTGELVKQLAGVIAGVEARRN